MKYVDESFEARLDRALCVEVQVSSGKDIKKYSDPKELRDAIIAVARPIAELEIIEVLADVLRKLPATDRDSRTILRGQISKYQPGFIKSKDDDKTGGALVALKK